MALRHRNRHLHATLVDFITTGLAEFDWMGTNVPYGAAPITIIDHAPDERGTPITANTVAISLGDEQEDLEQELGASSGGLYAVSVPVFVDVYGEQTAISIAIAGDIKQILKHSNLAMRDWSVMPPVPVPGMWIEIDEVLGPEMPPAARDATEQFRRNWRLIRAMSVTYFNEDQ